MLGGALEVPQQRFAWEDLGSESERGKKERKMKMESEGIEFLELDLLLCSLNWICRILFFLLSLPSVSVISLSSLLFKNCLNYIVTWKHEEEGRGMR